MTFVVHGRNCHTDRFFSSKEFERVAFFDSLREAVDSRGSGEETYLLPAESAILDELAKEDKSALYHEDLNKPQFRFVVREIDDRRCCTMFPEPIRHRTGKAICRKGARIRQGI